MQQSTRPNGEGDSARGSFDALDRRLISELQGDPRLPYATLGAKLGVTGMTAANRLQRLRQSGLIHFRVAPDFEACGLRTEILGLLSADVGALAQCLAALQSSPYVLGIERVTGEYDISFHAAFPSEAVMGTLVRDLQSLSGVRRLVVHHYLDRVKEDDGWSAVWAEPGGQDDPDFEIAAGLRIPEQLRSRVVTAAHWLAAFVKADMPTLRALSTDDLVFTIMEPHQGAGTYSGWNEVAEESRVAASIYRHLWHRIVGVNEARAPYDVMIDAYNTAERRRGAVRQAFTRQAYGFQGERVHRVLTLGDLDLHDVPEASLDSPPR